MMQYIFIHGLGQTASSWDKTTSFLPKADHVFSPDLWAMQNGKEVTYTNLYQGFSDFCNNLSGTLNLCGVSLGALLALNYTVDYPGKVQSIALIGAQYKMPKGLLKFQNIIFQLMPEKSFIKMGIHKKDIIKLTDSMVDLDFSAKLKDISCDALIICGDKDNANIKAAQSLAENIPNAKFHLIENAGHQVNMDNPEKLSSILNGFGDNLCSQNLNKT